MDIKILHLIEGAEKAEGLTVIIDVFRAFSTACYAFAKGAEEIIPVADIETAYLLKKQNPHYILMGERNEMKPEGFDFGNSPSLLPQNGLTEKSIVHTTSSGTQGIEAAVNASEIITGSFVNAEAIVSYIKSQNPETVSLVCMGYACLYPTDEDTLCAEYIKNELTGKDNDFEGMKTVIRNGSGKRFFEPENQSWSPVEDFFMCLDLNRFDFILKTERNRNLSILNKIEIPD